MNERFDAKNTLEEAVNAALGQKKTQSVGPSQLSVEQVKRVLVRVNKWTGRLERFAEELAETVTPLLNAELSATPPDAPKGETPDPCRAAVESFIEIHGLLGNGFVPGLPLVKEMYEAIGKAVPDLPPKTYKCGRCGEDVGRFILAHRRNGGWTCDPDDPPQDVEDAAWLDELERLNQAATPAPWTATEFEPSFPDTWMGEGNPSEPACLFAGEDVIEDVSQVIFYQSGQEPDKQAEANLRFVAALRNAASKLLPLARRGLQNQTEKGKPS